MSPIFSPHFQGVILKILLKPFFNSLRDYHPLSYSIPENFKYKKGPYRSPHTTFPLYYYNGFSLNYAAFSR